MGTLLFQPDSAGRVPQGVLVPWAAQRIEGRVQRGKDYVLTSKTKKCRLLALDFRLWTAEEKKILLIVPRLKDLGEAMATLQKTEAWLQPKTQSPLPNCETSNAIVYP